MTRFWLVNTDDTYRPEMKQYMIHNKSVCAQYGPKDTIDSISQGDVVFIYENKQGIIAYGVADGKVIISDFEGYRDEQHRMGLRNFGLLRESIAPREIRQLSQTLDGIGVYYAKTIVPLRTQTGAALQSLAQKRALAEATEPTTQEALPMSWWVYKCNSRQHEYQREYGDWRDLFGKNQTDDWGSSELVPDLARLKRGDMVIAYQTDRNELVGIAEVHQTCERDTYLYLTPIKTIGAKVRPLKKSDPEIASIPALQPGPVKTIYEISTHDAQILLKAAGTIHEFPNDVAVKPGKEGKPSTKGTGVARIRSNARRVGAGFGTPETNRKVERAAIPFVTKHYKSQGWRVKSVEANKCGFDLLCIKDSTEEHIEVKGVQGKAAEFIVTAREVNQAKSDKRFVLL